jgi:hypothetical protein
MGEGWQILAVGSELRMMLDGVYGTVQKLGIRENRAERRRGSRQTMLPFTEPWRHSAAGDRL